MDLQKAKRLSVTNRLVYWLDGIATKVGRIHNVTSDGKIQVREVGQEKIKTLPPRQVVTGSLTTGDIAKMFEVSTTTVWRWLDRGLIEYTEDGPKKGWRSIDIVALSDAVAQGRLPPRRGRPSIEWIASIADSLKISPSYVRQLKRRGIFSDPPTDEEIENFKSRPRRWG